MVKFWHKLSKKHYVQNGLAVLLTGLILWLAAPLWYKQIVYVLFEAQAEKDVQYQVFYTKKSGKSFNEEQSVKKNIEAGNQQVEIVVPIAKIAKFRLDIGRQPGNVVISDLRIRGSRKIWVDYKDFSRNQIDGFALKDGKLYLLSQQNDPYLVYKKELNLSGKTCIDWCNLIIMAVLGFLFSRKFIQYLSQFKIEKHHSRIDIVMLTVFFGLLFIPMLNISDAQKSEQENRMLAKFPQLMILGRVNNNFGAQFNEWFNDRFWGRNIFIKMYNKIYYSLNQHGGNEKVLIGNNGWLFYKLDNSVDNFANKVIIPEDDLKKGLKYLTDIDDWCKKHNKKFYYIIAPDKSKVYGEYYRFVKKLAPDEQGIGYQFINYIHKYSDIDAVYLLDTLIKHKKDGLLYYKQDTHWNKLGAYYGYRALMKLMRIAPKVYEFSFNKPYKGDLKNMIDTDIFDDYLYPETKSVSFEFCQKSKSLYDQTCVNLNGKRNLFLLGDSFSIALLPYLSDKFQTINTHHYFHRPLSVRDLDFIKKNVDIVVLENIERYIPLIMKLQFPQYPKD